MHDRQHAAQRHTAGRRNHVLFGNAALDEPLGQLGLERLDAAIRQQVRIQHDDVRALARHREQLVAVGEDEFLGFVGATRTGSGAVAASLALIQAR